MNDALAAGFMKLPGPREIGGFLWRTINEFFEDRCPTMAAALSYYSFFSLPPLLILLLMLLGALLDPEDVRKAIEGQIGGLVGAAGAEHVRTILERVSEPAAGRPLATLLGVGALLLGATTAFGELQAALNRSWGVEPDPRRGTIRNFLVKRVFSFGIVLVIAFFLLISLVLSTALTAFGSGLSARMPGPVTTPLLQILNFAISFGIVTLLFAAMFKIIPDADVVWRDVWTGAVVTALLFVLGKFLIGLYLGSTNPGDAYGAAGSLAVILIWVYYSSMIVLFGAEFTRVWAEEYGSGVEPSKGAVQVVEEKRPVRAG